MQFHIIRSNLDLPCGCEATMRGCWSGSGEKDPLDCLTASEKDEKKAQVSNVPPNQDDDYLNDGKSCPSS